LHDEATDVATDEQQTLSVTSGSASTVLPQGGAGIRLAGSGHCGGGHEKPKSKAGLQGSGTFRDLVKKHKGDMKAASREYRAVQALSRTSSCATDPQLCESCDVRHAQTDHGTRE
jgi:hypothetical protein